MKFILIVFIALSFSLKVNAHEYFFGFAEMSYNEEDKLIEGTLTMSTHDVEEWLRDKGLDIDELELHEDNMLMINQIENLLFNRFQIENNGEKMNLSFIGFEVLSTGVTHFHFHSSYCKKPQKLVVTFDLLMDKFPNQHNKITYHDGKESYTAIFLPNKTKSSISLR